MSVTNSCAVARDPSKRQVKPTPTVELFPLTLESESEDSDFKIEEDDGSDSDSGTDESLSAESEESEASDEECIITSGKPITEGMLKFFKHDFRILTKKTSY